MEEEGEDALFASALDAYDQVETQAKSKAQQQQDRVGNDRRAEVEQERLNNEGSVGGENTGSFGAGDDGAGLGDALADDFLKGLQEFDSDDKTAELMQHLLTALGTEEGQTQAQACSSSASSQSRPQQQHGRDNESGQRPQGKQQQQQPQQQPKPSQAAREQSGTSKRSDEDRGRAGKAQDEGTQDDLAAGLADMLQKMATRATQSQEQQRRQQQSGGKDAPNADMDTSLDELESMVDDLLRQTGISLSSDEDEEHEEDDDDDKDDEEDDNTHEGLTGEKRGDECRPGKAKGAQQRGKKKKRPDTGEEEDKDEDLFDGLLQTFLSKDLVYPSLKELRDKYPAFLEEQKTVLSPSDAARFSCQYEIIARICLEYEEDTPRMDAVTELMREMQQYGTPPEELMKRVGVEVDDQGNPAVPSLGQCCIS